MGGSKCGYKWDNCMYNPYEGTYNPTYNTHEPQSRVGGFRVEASENPTATCMGGCQN